MSLDQQLDLLSIEDLITSHDRRGLEAAIRRRCHTISIDPETILCRILGRYKFFVDCRDRGLAPHLMMDGYWEYWVSDFIWRNVGKGMTVVDVGANLGYYTVLMGDLVGAGGKVLAIEPNPWLLDLLQRNIDINGFSRWTECEAKAVAGRSGDRLQFRASVRDPKNGSLMGGASATDGDIIEVEVETLALNDLAVGAVDFMKIDVEGAEEVLWSGIGDLIRRSPDIKILLEFNALRCRDPQRMLEEISAAFPLRQLDDDAVVRPARPERLLAEREDTMLYLSRLEPVNFGQSPS
ncbi:FkbM family methyltransferase [Belnapia sp. F-4-1]|uniref:FkbM family methyltransferase n=1 Tax=Belnapia sp. F-4-1 TaxID=1545443 RepID=UPI0005BABCE1|nr:FkbM family methyltransferase [Belnapia sp. F-4-1]